MNSFPCNNDLLNEKEIQHKINFIKFLLKFGKEFNEDRNIQSFKPFLAEVNLKKKINLLNIIIK